ncbi:MAG: class I adenylate-forming enzyme family protein [Pseudomonadota bacterium]|nr:class I adenylate-forming enzyme family protein [Pseudomonadota bacterium]
MPIDMSNQPDLDIPFESTRALLKKWGNRDPSKTAIVDLDQDGKNITWGQLAVEADLVAQFLKDRGVQPGDKVALLSGENLEKLIIWMGIWRYGAAVCPLNVEMNEVHLVEILEGIEPALTLWHTDLDGPTITAALRTPSLHFGRWGTTFSYDTERPDLFSLIAEYEAGTGADIEFENGADDLSCIFCTSGTTSKPKSVVYNHMAYWLNGLNTLDMLGLTAEDRTLEYRSFGWNSAQILSLMPWLQTGLTMHIAQRFSRSRFFGWIREHGITFSAGVPTVVNMLLNEPPPESDRHVPSLRLMTCSTAPLSPDQWKLFESMYSVTLLQLYGMSEAGWICGNRHYRRRMGTVGPHAKHQEFIIVSSDGLPCSPNTEGEITIGGPQTCIGTISPDGQFDDLTNERIKTGDLGMMDDDGFVTVTGRTKDLIIRGGVNIAPLEIDNVLLLNPKIREAAAVGVPDQIYGEEVVAYVVVRSGEFLDEEEIKSWCSESLPTFKAPKRIFFMDDLPKSDRGKIRRDDLKDIWRKSGNS